MPLADGTTEEPPNIPGYGPDAQLLRLWCSMMPDGNGRVYVVPFNDQHIESGDIPACREFDTWMTSSVCLDALREKSTATDGLDEQQVSARVGASSLEDRPTTLDISGLPADMTQDDFIEILDREEASGLYDFIWMPLGKPDERRTAIVNMTRHEDAEVLITRLRNRNWWGDADTQYCEVAWSNPVQGFDELRRICRDMPENSQEIKESMQPKVFEHGFPMTLQEFDSRSA